MKNVAAGVYLLILCLFAGVATVSAAPLVLNHHGRLLDAADAPVADGAHTLIYSLFATPDGGSPLWSETREVTTQGGLFTCDLGRVVPLDPSLLTNDSLYLQVQVAGEAPLTPRLRLGATLRAGVSGGVQGDITTTPGSLSMTDPLGLRTVHNWAGDASAGIAIDEPGVHFAQMVTPDSLVYSQGTDNVSSRVMIHKIHRGEDLALRQAVYPDSTVFDQGGDFGTARVIHRDLAARNVLLAERVFTTGFDSASIREECDDNNNARLSINTKGTGAKREIQMSTGPDAGMLTIDDDSDGDGIPDTEISHTVMPASSSVAIKTKGTGADKDRSSIISTTGLDSAAVISSHDSDDDGIEDAVVATSVGGIAGGVVAGRIAIKTKGTAADGNRSMSITATTNGFSSAIHRSDYDDDGDGVPEQEVSQTLTPVSSNVAIKTKGTAADANRAMVVSSGTNVDSASAVCIGDLDGDGIPDMAITQTIVPGSSSMAIKTKGTGADKDRIASISSSTQLDSAAIVLGADIDGDGLSDQEIEQQITPTTASLAVATKGTGAKRVGIVTDPDSAGIGIDDSGIQMTMRTRKGWDGTVKGSTKIDDNGSTRVSFDSDGDGFLAGELGIGVASPTHPIDVSGGAYCDGANWVNASDKNLKENFQPVDGRDLLQKIDRLPISRWNYKNEPNDVVHIGPTAQDFKHVFGVGSDGTSISTIDPAGIALAAIQQLHKENLALKNQVAELQRRVETLTAQTAETEQIRAELRQLSAMVEVMMSAKTAGESAARLASSK